MSASVNRVVVMPAFHAAKTLARVPPGLFDRVLVCDDVSDDETFAVERIAWQAMADDFDAEFLVALHAAGLRGREVAVGSWYLPESSSVGLRQSVKYGAQVLASLRKYRRPS